MKRLLIVIVTFLFLSNMVIGEENEPKTALLIIDIQEFYFPGEGPGLLNAEETSEKASEILKIFRENEQLVIHVRHKSESGFEIHDNVKPTQDEKLITKEEINSFNGTDLLEYLKNNKVERLVIVGMQTQMCVEAATRAAYDFGYECIVIDDACTTRDLKYKDTFIKATEVHESTLATMIGGGYAKVIDLEEFKREVNTYLFKKL